MVNVKVGCCGFAGSMRDYYSKFNVVEVQRTFYKMPRESTLKRWRMEAPEDFEFTVKAYQAITHPKTSPTWRMVGRDVAGRLPDDIGHLKPSLGNFEAWRMTMESMKILRAKICLVQCPPSFTADDENIGNMRRFFSEVEREGVEVAWEPRHISWYNDPDRTRRLLDSLSIIDVVDIFKRAPLSSHPIGYVRLHGLNGEINYSYSYSDSDLQNLKVKVSRLCRLKRQVYVLFNNITMKRDSLLFKAILGEGV
ncbi:MAG: DUF72 domain-containing protein [Candidatus Bathyarchaeia archaeon]